jgi:N-methylhydantoinase A
MVDVLSIGAGGGSIAWLDAGGFLHVGPQSAGAAPGPVCYGRGGTEPTVTDANLVLGRLNPAGLLGGRVVVDRDAAIRAIRDKIAAPMGLSVEEAAVGILTMLNENMVQGVRVTSVERGHDPREFALLAFGGGGPLLAAQLAAELGMRRVIIPRSPGLLCAEGLLVADTRADFSKTRIVALDAEVSAEVVGLLEDLDAMAKAWFAKERVAEDRRSTHFAIDMRYRGQSHELRIPMRSGIEAASMISGLREAFTTAHRRMYGFAPDEDVELVTFRAVASARTFSYPRQPIASKASATPTASRDVYFEEARRYLACPVFERTALGAGVVIDGPAVIEQMDTTTIVRPDQSIRVHPYGEMILTLNATEASRR